MLSVGVNRVVTAVEKKKASLVVIAHDVDPLEIVLFLPTLCRKMGVQYCIVKVLYTYKRINLLRFKGKARLGRLVGLKTASCVALTDVNAEDKNALAKIVESVNTNYMERADMIRKTWGGQIMSQRTNNRIAKMEKLRAKEEAKKAIH